jgi:hypothetical protein
MGALALGASPAMALEINCPLTVANRTLADALPGAWRVVPYAERLGSTSISTSGTLQTLSCHYGQAGTVQQNGPKGYLCRSHPAGFTCALSVVTDGTPHTAVLDPTPLVHSAGNIRVNAGVPMPSTDLDGGGPSTRVPSPNDITFTYSPETGWSYYTFGWVWPHMGTTPQGKAGCRAGLTGRMSTLSVPPVGTHVCLLTNGGRVSEFKVTGISNKSPQFVTISYTTWPR